MKCPTFELPSAVLERERNYKISQVTSTVTVKVSEDLIFYRRNLYFENLVIFFKPKEKCITFILRNKKTNTPNAILKVSHNNITFYQRKERTFRKGFVSFYQFYVLLMKNFPGIYEPPVRDCSNQVNCEIQHFLQLFVKCCNYKHIGNIYYKFYNGSSEINVFQHHTELNASKSKIYFFKRLRKCRGLRDVCMFLFGKKDKCYRQYVASILQMDNSLVALHYIYLLLRKCHLSPQDIIKIPEMKFYDVPFVTKYYQREFTTFGKQFTTKQIINCIKTNRRLGYCIMLMRDVVQMRQALTEEQRTFVISHNLPIHVEHDLLSAMIDRPDKQIYKLPRYPELDVLDNTVVDGWQIQLPSTTKDLIRWGNENHFCIGSYDTYVVEGSCYCLSLVNVVTGERYCAELVNFNHYNWVSGKSKKDHTLTVSQLRGKCNKEAPEELQQLAVNLFGKIKLTLKQHEKELIVEQQQNNIVTFENKVAQYLRELEHNLVA